MHTTKITKSFSHKYQVGDTVYYRGKGRQDTIQKTKIVEVKLNTDTYEGDYVSYQCSKGRWFHESEISTRKDGLINNEIAIIDECIKSDENGIDNLEKAIRECEVRIESLKQKKQDLIVQLP